MRRLILLFLLLPVWLQGGCQSKQEPETTKVVAAAYTPKKPVAESSFPRNYNNTAAIDAFYKRLEMQEEEHPDIRKASEFITNPFLPASDPSLRQYISLIKAKCVLMKDTITNLHNARYTDSLFQLTFDSSTVELYYPMYSRQYLLSYAHVKSDNLPLNNGIQVGTSREELLKKLQEYKLYIKEEKNTVEVCDWERNSWLRFNLAQGHVSSIEYEGYVD